MPITSSETRLGLHVELRLVEIFQELLEAAVAVLGLAEIGLAVEVDIAEYPFEFTLVALFNMVENDIDQLADIGRRPALIEAVVSGRKLIQNRLFAGLFILLRKPYCGKNKTFTLQLAADASIVIAVLLPILFVVVLPDIGDVFQKQHHEDVILVLCRIDNPPEGVAGRPCRVVDVFLIDFAAHFLFSFCKLH